MRVIFKIAKTELKLLFYSPIAWFLLIVFIIQCARIYFGNVSSLVNAQEIRESSKPIFTFVTERLFILRTGGLFPSVMKNLYLFLPLLTMGLISKELSNGTIKLLYTSPIRITQIVLGKYLSILAYTIILMGVVVIFVVFGIFHVENPEITILLSALLGFFLLLATYAAIGLFMSSLTSYQVVAAISTFVMIGILSFIGSVWQDIPFFREITYFLSINGRTEKILSGLITTKDIVYFLLVIYLFLGLTILKLKSGTESKPLWSQTLRYLGIISSVLLVGYITSIHTLVGYLDVTSDKRKTLTPRVQEIIKNFGEEPLKVTNYANALNRHFVFGTPALFKYNQSKWEMYHRFKSNISLESVMYYDSVKGINIRVPGKEQPKTLRDKAKKFIKQFDLDVDKDLLSPEEIRNQIDLSAEENRFVIKLDWKDRSTFLRLYDDPLAWPSETEVAAALLRLQKASLPKILFLTGELERDIDKLGDDAYKVLTNLPSFRNSLVNQGFDVGTIDLSKENIPDDITVLVIADPRVGLSEVVLEKVNRYINSGGNLFIAAEPNNKHQANVLKPILDSLGVELMSGQIIQASRHYAPDFVEAYMSEETKSLYQPISKMVNDSVQVTMSGTSALRFNTNLGFQVKTFVKSDGKTSWNTTEKLDFSLKKRASLTTVNNADTLGVVSFSVEKGNVLQALPTVIGLSRNINGKEQHIVVSGDADFLSNAELRRSRTSNFGFSTSLFSWLSSGEFPVDTTRPSSQDRRVLLSSDQLKVQRILISWVLPIILLGIGAIILIRRKRK